VFKKRKAWNKLTQFIRVNRGLGVSDFTILTTDNELIIIVEYENRKDKIRIKY